MSWPPESLKVNTEDIINECELMEVMPSRGGGKQFIQVVELAALLYTGDYVHGRHVWRRWKDNNPPILLQDWWRVGAAMMDSGPAETIWKGLEHIRNHHPAPLNAYATEVGTAYRIRILQRFSSPSGTTATTTTTTTISHPPYLELLNVSSPAELEGFCNEHGIGPMNHPSTSSSSSQRYTNGTNDTTTGLAEVVGFLEAAHTASFKA